MVDWEIEKPLGQCHGTGKKIEFDEEYFAALVETEQGLERRDFCREYWVAEKPQVYCYWKTKLSHRELKKQLFVDDDMLMAFFERLGEESEQEKIDFRFVLTLVLMRKRLLKYDSSKTEGEKEIWRLRFVGRDKEFTEVINPQLDEGQVEQLSGQIGEILHMEL